MARIQVPAGWDVARLGEIAELIMGQSPPSSTYNTDGIGLPFFQGKAEFGETFPVVAKYCSKPLRIAEPDDILLSVRAPVGPTNISPLRCCIGRGLCAIRTVKGKVDQMYLFFYLRLIEEKLTGLGQGSTFGAVGKKDLENLEVPYPANLEEQRRIVSVLQKATLLGQKRSEADQIASKVLQSVFLEMFRDPITNPRDWRKEVLDTYTSIKATKGSTPTTYGHKWEEQGMLFLRSECITENGISLNGSMHISKNAHDFMRRSKVHPGDILIRITGEVGISTIFPKELGEANINQHIAIIRLKENSGIETIFLVSQLNSKPFRNYYSSITRGVTHPHLSLQQIRETKIVIPPVDLQARFVPVASRIESMRAKQNQSAQESNELHKTLMLRAFKGELFKEMQEASELHAH